MLIQALRGRWTESLSAVAFCGFNSALVYLFVFLLPFQLFQYYYFRLPQFTAYENASAAMLLVGWVILFQLYYVAYRRCPERPSAPLLAMLFGFPLFFSLLLYFMYPFGSNDVFDAIFRGHLFGNLEIVPFGRRPEEFPGEPLLEYAIWRQVPGTYGPVWHLLTGGISRLAGTSDVLPHLLGYKLLTLLHYWGAALLVYLGLRRFRPAHATRGLLLFAWNPLLLFEAVGSAHNDMLLVFWLVAAAFLLLRERYIPALLALTVAALVKFISAMLLPLFLAALWHAHRNRPLPYRVRQVALAAIAMSALAVAAYAPFGLHGALASLANLTEMTANQFHSSTPWVVFYHLRNTFGLTWMQAQDVRNFFFLITLGLVFWHTVRLLRVRGGRETMKRELLQRSFLVLLIYLLISSPWVWPWYVTWLLPFLPFALDMGTGYVERVLLFSFGLLGNYLIWFYRWPFNAPTNDDNELIVYWLAFVPILFVSLAIWSYQLGARLGRSAPGPAPARRARAAGVRSERV